MHLNEEFILKLFGEFLIDKKVINKFQLYEALIAQIEQQPCLQRISLELKLLEVEQLLEIIKEQSLSKISFLEVVRSKEFWNQEKEELLFRQLEDTRRPLGEILLQNKTTDIGTLTKSLDEFFDEKNKNVSK